MDGTLERLGRRALLRRGVALGAALVSLDALTACDASPAASAPSPAATPRPSPTPTPLPPPETTTIRLTTAVCDAPLMAAERYLRDEGFTNVEIGDAASIAAITGGKAELGQAFATPLAVAVEAGRPIVGIAGIHPGCAEVWAPRSIGRLADLRGRTVVVQARTADNLAYTFLALALKNAGVDPNEVNFVAQANADPVKAYLDGASDAVFVITTAAVALRANSANKGHVILDQTMDKPWSELDCCILCANPEWLKANPISARRALRAILRAADAQGPDRADAVKAATEKGLFGGARNYEAARAAANMVPLDWRALDPAKSLRTHTGLMAQVGLLKAQPDELTTKALDLAMLRELRDTLRR